MPDSIFYVSMGWGMTQFFSLGMAIAVFLRIEEMDVNIIIDDKD